MLPPAPNGLADFGFFRMALRRAERASARFIPASSVFYLARGMRRHAEPGVGESGRVCGGIAGMFQAQEESLSDRDTAYLVALKDAFIREDSAMAALIALRNTPQVGRMVPLMEQVSTAPDRLPAPPENSAYMRFYRDCLAVLRLNQTILLKTVEQAAPEALQALMRDKLEQHTIVLAEINRQLDRQGDGD